MKNLLRRLENCRSAIIYTKPEGHRETKQINHWDTLDDNCIITADGEIYHVNEIKRIGLASEVRNLIDLVIEGENDKPIYVVENYSHRYSQIYDELIMPECKLSMKTYGFAPGANHDNLFIIRELGKKKYARFVDLGRAFTLASLEDGKSGMVINGSFVPTNLLPFDTSGRKTFTMTNEILQSIANSEKIWEYIKAEKEKKSTEGDFRAIESVVGSVVNIMRAIEEAKNKDFKLE